ncbi:MAG: hypothetical protein AABY15_03200 [Nanoarchaeota archaeon]
MEDKKPIFHLEIVTEEDAKKKLQETIENLKEEQKTDIKFGDEFLYCLGNGHDFVFGFFTSYVTKSGAEATHYWRGNYWKTSMGEYELKDGEFIKLPEVEVSNEPLDWNEVMKGFPVVKNVSARTLADDLKPVKPKKQ